MKKINLLRFFVIAIASFFSICSYATQLSTKGESVSRITSLTAPPNKKTPQVTLSFNLFQKLIEMNTNGVLQYLKQKGCKIEHLGETYSCNVRGGTITIYPKKISFPRMGVGPVEFATTDRNVCNNWYKSLANAGYSNEYTDNKDIWVKERCVYGCPTFGVTDWLGDGSTGEDYAGCCTLFVKKYWEE